MTKRDLAAAVVLSSALAFAVGYVSGVAARASRPALDPIPAPLSVTAETGPGGTAIGGFPVLDSKGKTGPEQAGVPDLRGSGHPTSVFTGGSSPSGEPSAEVRGILSHVGTQFGPRYLALPGGPGIRVRLCGAGGCMALVSTDAGPDKAMQRAGRVADSSSQIFARVCALPPTAGLCKVTVHYGAAAAVRPPATDG